MTEKRGKTGKTGKTTFNCHMKLTELEGKHLTKKCTNIGIMSTNYVAVLFSNGI